MKKKIVIIGLIVLVITLSVIFISLMDSNSSNKKEDYENYDMYIKINPKIKISFEANDNSIGHVISYELLNNDAMNIYSNFDFKNKELYDALVQIIAIAKENNIEFNNVEIISNYSFKSSEIQNYINKNTSFENISVLLIYKDNIAKEDVFSVEEIEEQKIHTVSFDSSGGTNVSSQFIKDGEKVSIPENPTKEGYSFVEWQLNNSTYNFDNEINQDITLVARWEKLSITTSKKNTTLKETSSKTKNTSTTIKQTSTTGTTSTTTTSTTTTTTTPISTYDRINLNDNIYVIQGGGYGEVLFSTNYYELFGNNGYDYNKRYDFMQDEKYDDLIYDTNEENKMLSFLKKMKGIRGINLYSNYGSSHIIEYKYNELSFQGDSSLEKELNSKIQEIWIIQDRTYWNNAIWIDGGYGSDGPELLTESICNNYNLICDRW